jgi:DNA adenine methylase
MSGPRRPALRYHGGKWRLAPWLLEYFPPHVCYVEPYGGGASVLLRKPLSHLEVYNDIDEEVVHFFRILRERTDELVHVIQLTPFSRAEVGLAYETCEDPLERARRFYVRAWQARGGPRGQWRTGWRYQITHARGKRSVDDWCDTGHLWAIVERLRRVQFECDHALSIIRRYDNPTTLFYIDPPYPADTRSLRWRHKAYTHEMSDEDHTALAECLQQLKGMAIVSSYRSPLYDELYASWTRACTKSQTDGKRKGTECIWLNQATQLARTPLFSILQETV